MTNAQYFSQQLGFAPTSNMVEAAMIDNDLTGSDTYVKANMLVLKTAALAALEILLSTPDVWQGTGETQNKVTYDREAILKSDCQVRR
jgi:hypothetical protein